MEIWLAVSNQDELHARDCRTCTEEEESPALDGGDAPKMPRASER
jgi:hypothetical protein